MATYRDTVQDLPQYPTTCFSKSPIVTPMWAHYGKDHSGFVLEFDADALRGHFDGVAVEDVTYRDEPDTSIVKHLERAAAIAKPRHVYWLRQAVLHHAYFSKHTSWTYEQECRLVDQHDFSEDIAGNRILFVPIECVTSVIAGHKIAVPALQASVKLAEANDLDWYQAVIGKSHGLPFFKNGSGRTFVFGDECIEAAAYVCETCAEPVAEGHELCPWCSITEQDEINAASRNPYRILDRYNLLGRYIKDAEKISGST
ncbi:DUF2971 domain-containing protein [Sphingomonas sp. DBB INV C78]|uniref:DUF2971 domain-containing protein n=1 Tax=Sphingomonas sp. DBB INV C78 TaxID=3349434 RepID=UPI0036D2F23B